MELIHHKLLPLGLFNLMYAVGFSVTSFIFTHFRTNFFMLSYLWKEIFQCAATNQQVFTYFRNRIFFFFIKVIDKCKIFITHEQLMEEKKQKSKEAFSKSCTVSLKQKKTTESWWYQPEIFIFIVPHQSLCFLTVWRGYANYSFCYGQPLSLKTRKCVLLA